MGNGNSSTQIPHQPSDPQVLRKLRDQNYNNHLSEPFQSNLNRSTYLTSAFAGIWSMDTPSSICPAPRSGQFCVYDDESGCAYIGYGILQDGKTMNDVWCLFLSNLDPDHPYKWKQIQLNGDIIKPRTGSKAFLYKGLIYVFGGYSDPDYLSCLHTIDIKTGSVHVLEFSGEEPVGRSTPIIYVNDDKVYIWGGYYKGNFPTDLYIYDIQTKVWRQVAQNIVGRTAANSVVYKGLIYSYGGSTKSSILCIDPEKEIVFEKTTNGSEPEPYILNAQMVLVDKYAFFIGGKSNSKFTLIYACDLERLWWFVFHIKPDRVSANTSNGYVNEIGMFLVPSLHSFALFYSNKRREIGMTLGIPTIDPPPISTISIGEALGFLHIRDDMIDAFHLFDS